MTKFVHDELVKFKILPNVLQFLFHQNDHKYVAMESHLYLLNINEVTLCNKLLYM